MEIISDSIDTFIYYNEDTGYGIFYLKNGVKAVGFIPRLDRGQLIELKGNWNSHTKYGKQFNVESFSLLYPETSGEIIKFLSSGIIKGIGEKTAMEIVKKFGEKTFDILDNKIDRLSEIKGFGKKKIKKIEKSWEMQKGIKDIIIFLQGYGITTATAMRIFKVYGDQTKTIIQDNPYKLTYDITGIAFKLADKIALNAGYSYNHPNRIKAGILHVLKEAARYGHTYLPESKLIPLCENLLNQEISRQEDSLIELENEKSIKINNYNIYLSYLVEAENEIEKQIVKLISKSGNAGPDNLKWIKKIQNKFSEEQLNAIKKSLENNLLILTGGPGTGKTETLKGIINIYEKMNKKILMAAPTGRAAKKMSEVIGRDAKTIHRLLEYSPVGEFFKYNKENVLDADLLVIDEVSMIDTVLMYCLLNAIGEKTTLILVGDSDQLPSVGPGNVLSDFIKSEKIPYCTLTKIFRQAEQSKIIITAHQINKGEFPDLSNSADNDLFFIEEENDSEVSKTILDLCTYRLPSKYNFNPMQDIQVLTPMHKGEIGTLNLNKTLQKGLNNGRMLVKKGNSEFKEGDKVMQLRNNYEKEVFNGDIGIITGKDEKENSIIIEFNNKHLKYHFTELDELTLAYAITVHKSQGSEYPCVILPLSTSHFIMLQRNLLYTAITRAKEIMVIIGSKKAMEQAIRNNRVVQRYTSIFKKSHAINFN